MSLITVPNTAGTNTSSAAPASVTTTVPATTAGNTLLLFVSCANSGAPTVANPGGWLVGPSIIQGTAVSIHSFYLPNCAAGITSIVNNLTNVNGCCTVYDELSNTTLVNPLDSASIQTASNAGSTAVSVPTYTNITTGAQLWCGIIACISTATITDTSIGGRGPWVSGGSGVSTVGATNVRYQYNLMSSAQGANPSNLAQVVATLSSSVAWCAMMVNLNSTSSIPYKHGTSLAVNTDSGTGFGNSIPG